MGGVLIVSKCSACNTYFDSVTAFDVHRVGEFEVRRKNLKIKTKSTRRCMTLVERSSTLELDDKGRWRVVKTGENAMGSIKGTVTGGAGRDAELSYTQAGKAICKVSLGVTLSRKNYKTKEKEDSTTWVRVVLFDGAAESAAALVEKGKRYTASGRFTWLENSENYGLQGEFIADSIVNEVPDKKVTAPDVAFPSDYSADAHAAAVEKLKGSAFRPVPDIHDYVDKYGDLQCYDENTGTWFMY